jgi:hypothetical protein
LSSFKIIYQTLQDRDNPNEIEGNGPFKCRRKNAWLGQGYYFWESYVENAHWWGEISCFGKYVICKAKVFPNEDNCFDLVDNPMHLEQLRTAADMISEKGLSPSRITVGNVVQFLKDNFDSFQFECVRAKGERVRLPENKFSKPVYFTANGKPYLDLNPPIQICLFGKTSLDLQGYMIVYPEDYVIEDYTI